MDLPAGGLQMSSTSHELLRTAQRCADKLDLSPKLRRLPSFADVEEQCEAEYEEVLGVLHEDEVFAPVDVNHQEQLVRQIEAALPDAVRPFLEELTDNFSRHVWLQQEAAYHVGVAVGLRLAQIPPVADEERPQ
jgi:hypothetical protein